MKNLVPKTNYFCSHIINTILDISFCTKKTNRYQKVFHCLILILLFGCRKENVEPQIPIPKIYEYNVSSMLYPTGAKYNSSKVKLSYNQDNRISQRIGNLIGISPGSGFSYYLNEDISDILHSVNNLMQLLL